MDRRKFLKHLPLLGALTFRFSNAFGTAFPRLFIPLNDTIGLSSVTIQKEGLSPFKLPIWWNHKIAYISAFKFAGGFNFHTYFNDTKRKIVLYLPNHQVVVTANNAFVIVDKEAYQMPMPALWQNDEIFIPIQYFIGILNRHTSLHFTYNESTGLLTMSRGNYNITGVSISEKKNGTVIRVKTTKKFKQNEITTDMRYGWLHVDFYGGKADAQLVHNVRPGGLVRKLKQFQFEQLLSLAFLLKKEPLSREVILKPENNEVLIVLRTQENISDEDLAELREESPDAPSEEIQKQLEEERRKWLIDVVVIDAGHGGKDPGAIGAGKIYEKNVVLPIAKKLGKIIQKEMPEVKVVYTRTTDKFIPLRRRTQIANENNGKVFISIHANSNKKKRISGFETYILGPEKGDMAKNVVLKENSVIHFEDVSTRKKYEGINQILATMAQNAFSRQSEYLASLVQQELDKQLHSLRLPNRGVKQGPFWVMVGATMPNILVETGFISNPYDAKILRTSAYQYKIARGIFEGLRRFKRDYENAI